MFDLKILLWIQEVLANPFLDTVMPWITLLGDHGYIWIALVIYFLCRKNTRWLGLFLGLTLLVELGVVEGIIKQLVQRPRPFTIIDIDLLIKAPSSTSFPSGHTASSFAAATYLMFNKRKIWPLAMVLASLIAFSRCYLFVHYPSDVIVGMILGSLLGYLGYKAYTYVFERYVKPTEIQS